MLEIAFIVSLVLLAVAYWQLYKGQKYADQMKRKVEVKDDLLKKERRHIKFLENAINVQDELVDALHSKNVRYEEIIGIEETNWEND